jgi:hypothetical protein
LSLVFKREESAVNTNRDFGEVSINHNVDHPDARHLPYPTNRLLGLVSSEESAWRAVERLKSEGIEEDQIELFFGEAGAAALHSVHDNSGLLGHLRQITGNLGPEPEQSKEYEEALGAGRILLGVKAPDESLVERIRDALVSEGCQSLRYYGRLAIRDLS